MVIESPRVRRDPRFVTVTPAKKDMRPDIQLLRAVAVGAVLLYHLWPNRMTGGFVGVDVFFVLSGFLITLHLCERVPHRAADLLAFWARRVRRLLPASLVVPRVLNRSTARPASAGSRPSSTAAGSRGVSRTTSARRRVSRPTAPASSLRPAAPRRRGRAGDLVPAT